jgi:cytochrome c
MRMSLMVAALSAFLLPLLLSTVGFAAADPASGEKLFKAKCAVCHTVEPGKNKIGPSLAGIVGRPSGSVAGFKYSPANFAANVTWDEPTLDKYLIDPKALIKGTTMPFAGDKNDAERADLIAYLKSLKSAQQDDAGLALLWRLCGLDGRTPAWRLRFADPPPRQASWRNLPVDLDQCVRAQRRRNSSTDGDPPWVLCIGGPA